MNDKLQEKLILTTIGFGFLALNGYALKIENKPFALGFGVVAFIFFIRSLRIK